jgi:hypothetical protein
VIDLFHLLSENGWTPYPPGQATQVGKWHVRWVRRCPGGTTVTLYQEPSTLATAGDAAESMRFRVDYAVHDVDEIAAMLAEFTARIDELDHGRP